jgi:hypothetical protein
MSNPREIDGVISGRCEHGVWYTDECGCCIRDERIRALEAALRKLVDNPSVENLIAARGVAYESETNSPKGD